MTGRALHDRVKLEITMTSLATSTTVRPQSLATRGRVYLKMEA